MSKRPEPMTDAELELAKARHLGRVLDAILASIPNAAAEVVTTYEQTEVCVCCGAHSIRATRDPKAPATRSVVCAKCSTGDRPASYDLPSTGW